jgi:hypothetical protein
VVGCTKRGKQIQYAGTFTNIGELIGKCVREGVKTAIFKQENIVPNRPLVDRLADRCLSIETIVSQVSEGKIKIQSPEHLKLQKRLELILSDPRIAPLVIASLRLDEDLAKGLIPKKAPNIVDQALFDGIVKAVLKYSEYDFPEFSFSKAKPEDEAQLGPFTKYVLKAIVNGASSKIS